MVLALRAMNPNFDHIRDQILTGQEVPSMDSLMTRLLRVPTPRKIGNSLEHSESSAMVSTRGRGGHGNRGGCGGRNTNSDLRCSHCKKWGPAQDKCYYIIGGLIKQQMSPNQKHLILSFLKRSIKNTFD